MTTTFCLPCGARKDSLLQSVKPLLMPLRLVHIIPHGGLHILYSMIAEEGHDRVLLLYLDVMLKGPGSEVEWGLGELLPGAEEEEEEEDAEGCLPRRVSSRSSSSSSWRGSCTSSCSSYIVDLGA